MVREIKIGETTNMYVCVWCMHVMTLCSCIILLGCGYGLVSGPQTTYARWGGGTSSVISARVAI